MREREAETVREQDRFIRAIMDTSPALVYVYDLTTQANVYANAGLERLLGYTPEELHEIGKELFSRLVHPDDLPRVIEFQSKMPAAGDGDVLEVEYRMRRRDGTWRTLHSYERPFMRSPDGSLQQKIGIAIDITERKRAEAALREEEDRFRDLVENSNDLICTHDLNGVIHSANPAAMKALGYPADEFLGMNLQDLLVPEKRSLFSAYLKRLQWRGYARGLMFVRTAAGEERIWEYNNTLRREGVAAPIVRGMARDITDKRRAEEKLTRSEAEFRRLSQEFHGLLDAIPDSLMLLDPDLNVLWANQAAAEALGKTGDALTGRHCYALWYNLSAACEPCPVARSFTTGRLQSETVERPDGRIWDIRTVPLLNAKGRTTRVIELKRDITAHRRVEEQLRHAQKLEEIGQLAGGIAHDFNNVLGVVIGFAGVLQMKLAEGDPQRHFVDEIIAAGERGAELTRQILAFSRKQIFDLKPARLNDIVRSLEKMLRRLTPENITLPLDLAGEDPVVLVDTGQIEQVLINLVTNARDAIAGCGSIGIATGRFAMDRDFVELHGYGAPGEYAVLAVSDTGRGMDAATRARIFEPFFTTKGIGKGTGLGLAVVHGIVKQHQGYINVYSEPGKGTVIRVYLPLASGAGLEKMTAKPQTQIKGGSETVLIAEDDEILRKLSRTVLSQHGYTVIEAEDGEDAVAKFAANQAAIQLVILDGLMPKTGGIDALAEIRRRCPGIKAVFMSGYAKDIFSVGDLRDQGAAFIQKPVMPTDLLRTVREVLDGLTGGE